MTTSRRRTRAIATVVALLGAAFLAGEVGTTDALPIGVPLPTTPTELAPTSFHLRLGTTTPPIAQLEAALPKVALAEVIADANRDMEPCPVPSMAPGVAGGTAMCFSVDDTAHTDWYPQGITTSADADASGLYRGQEVLLASWYNRRESGIDKGARLSVVDWSDAVDPDYRNVLLVEPFMNGGTVDFRQLAGLHAGGIAWYGDLLYVVDTALGLRVFDTTKLFRVTTGSGTKIGRQSDGTYHAFDYSYVLPQVATYEQYQSGGQGRLRLSWVSVDRTSEPDSLIMGEFQEPVVFDGTNTPQVRLQTRLVRFPIPAGLTDFTATEAYDMQTPFMQGATAVNGTFLISTSGTQLNNGNLVTFRRGGSPTYYPQELPIGCEDVSYWGALDQLFVLSEFPDKRAITILTGSTYLASPLLPI